MPAIETRDLTRWYGRHRGIEALDLVVQPGEVFGFLGPNGAGKTTTIRLLLDLIRPTRGAARVLGFDCHRQSVQVRRRVGYLPGEFRFYEDLTGRQLLTFLGGLGGRGGLGGLGRRGFPGDRGGAGRASGDGAADSLADGAADRLADGTADRLAHRLAHRLGADLTRPIRTLSHGNKQKLAIVQAFMHRAPLLILDEPTTGLDPLVQQEFFALVDEARADGRTVLLSSHNLAEVERVCDRFASVRDGELIAVEDMATRRQRAVRLVTLVCARPLDRAAFAHLPGLDHLTVQGTTLQATVHGTVGDLLAAAAPYEVVDVLSREPSLEEFFLALYGASEAPGHGVEAPGIRPADRGTRRPDRDPRPADRGTRRPDRDPRHADPGTGPEDHDAR